WRDGASSGAGLPIGSWELYKHGLLPRAAPCPGARRARQSAYAARAVFTAPEASRHVCRKAPRTSPTKNDRHESGVGYTTRNLGAKIRYQHPGRWIPASRSEEASPGKTECRAP